MIESKEKFISRSCPYGLLQKKTIEFLSSKLDKLASLQVNSAQTVETPIRPNRSLYQGIRHPYPRQEFDLSHERIFRASKRRTRRTRRMKNKDEFVSFSLHLAHMCGIYISLSLSKSHINFLGSCSCKVEIFWVVLGLKLWAFGRLLEG